MLFLIAKNCSYRVRHNGYVYALLLNKPPPVPETFDKLDVPSAISAQGVVPLNALDRIRWTDRMVHEDRKEGGIIVERRGLTELKGRLYWKGKMVGPEIRLEFSWIYTLEPNTGKYLLTHAELEDNSTHDLVDAFGKETPFKAALFTIRHALGKNPTLPPARLQRNASGVPYRLAVAEDFLAEVNEGKSRYPGVDLWVRPDDHSDDVAYLDRFRVKATDERRRGVGSEVMSWIVALADKHDVTVKLHVEPFGEEAPTKSQVKRFYRNFGFRDRKLNWMVRKPRTAMKEYTMELPKRVRHNGAVYTRVDDVRKAWNNKPGEVDPHAAHDLVLFVQTTEPMQDLLFERYYPPMFKRLEKGTYDRDKAIVHFAHFAEHAAKAYVRDNRVDMPWFELFNPATRMMTAQELRDVFEDSDEFRALQQTRGLDVVPA